LLIPPRQIKISLITAPEFNLEYLWWLTILFLVLSVIYFVGVFLIRNNITANNKRTKEKKVEFSPMINEFLFYDDSNSKEEKMNYLNLKVQIRELIKNKFDRHVLTEVLLDLRKDLSGQSQDVLIHLYKDLGLHHDAYEKLGSSKWQVVSSGILELTTMEVDEAYGLIIKFINHRQSTVRKQAEIAVVNLKEEGIKYFLDNTKYKIAEWQQLKLLDVLRHKPNYTPPQFGLWLTSTNTHVVLFSLRLIKYYSQNDAEQSIITLLKHKKKEIQAEAIECIKEFHFVSALPTLIMVYPKASHDIKIAILDAIGELGSASEVPFLEKLKATERHFNIKGKVIGTLNKINPESVLPTKNISQVDFYEPEFEAVEEVIEDEILESLIEPSSSIETEEVIENTDSIEVEIEGKDDLPVIENEIIENTAGVASTEISTEPTASVTEQPKSKPEVEEQIGELDLSFLPHVMGENETNVGIINDDVTELGDEETEDTVLEIENEDFTFNFLPLVIDDVVAQEDVALEEPDALEPMFVLENEVLNQVGKVTETLDREEDFDEELSIDWTSIISENDKNNLEDATIEPILEIKNGTVNFSANFMPEEELETMVILENISELGDCRELGLLYDIIEENTSELVIERANELIEKFSYQTPRPNDLLSEDSNLAMSVFTDIYHQADHETKLMLIHEIKIVGDEKEFRLLNSIIDSTSNDLSKEANEALNAIKIRLALPKEEVQFEGAKNSIFDVNFELEITEKAKNNVAHKESGSTLFDQLCSMSNSLYNKKNG